MSEPDAGRVVLRQAASVSLATGAYGVSFGALAVAAGFSVAQACALSLLMFTGGSQFALVGVIGAGGAGSAAIATSAFLGIRNGFYALQLTKLLGATGPRRVAAAHLTIDESTAVALGAPDRDTARRGFWATGVGVFVLWNLFTVVGALAGDALGDPKRYGLDAAASAAFLGLLWPRLRTADTRAVAVVAALVAVALAPRTPAGVPVLVAALVALAGGLWQARSARSEPRAPRDPRAGGDA